MFSPSSSVIIYAGLPILSLGILGGICNIIIFLSLETFRQSSCAFYLLFMSWINIGQLSIGHLSRIIITGYHIDWTGQSLIFCKFRWFAIQTCILTSYICLCCLTIDQYLATSSRNRLQQWSNIKTARYLCLSALIFSILHGIPCLIYYNHSIESICIITNHIYTIYNLYIYVIFLSGIVPIFITVIFGILAYRNVRQIPYRTVPLVRRELDKQLTSMTLIQCFSSLIIISIYILWTITILQLNPNMNETLQIINAFMQTLYYLYFASPFYIYICVSERFRQQLFYVLFRRQNQIIPH